LRLSPVVQKQVALAEAKLRAAHALLQEALQDAWQGAVAGGLTLDQRMSIRLAATHATHQAREVVELCWQEAGATAIFDANPFERRLRDMHSITQQVQARGSHYETVGQHLLGMPASLRFV
jgi:alkylation response protein AidB-like acyl-CoA dehydrogenase